jgi:alkanesulfonate monooxygenase SsuD/methylene tetrahydromethanopterin reductase-like flavin-dependent oxidoreductase (luciferase family)
MRIGVSVIVQNSLDWDRFEASEKGEQVGPPQVSDASVWRDELEFAGEIEPLGFDSIWTIEHHNTPYAMVPDPLQFLSYVAGMTSKVDVGTMVLVLPWHNPMRVAEQLVLLQSFLGPDRVIRAGFGRGAGQREFPPMFSPMSESRGRFNEGLEVLRLALSEERFSYHGEHYQFDDISLRPRPADASAILDNLHGAWGTPQSQPVVAATGLKPLIIPQRAWADYHGELANFAEIRAERGFARAKPIIIVWAYCAKTEPEAAEVARRYIPPYADTALRHYELLGEHFKDVKGYEFYAEMREQLVNAPVSPHEALHQVWIDNSLWGTPEQCIEKLRGISETLDPEEIVLVLKYADMPLDLAQRSMRLFAKEVLPALQELPAPTAA